MPPFGMRIKLKTTGKGYVSSPFLLLRHRNIMVIKHPKCYFVLENRGLSTAPPGSPPQMRGKVIPASKAENIKRITPADAGKR